MSASVSASVSGNPIGQGYRPCGACRAYVPAATGCRKHWKPELSAAAREEPLRNRAARAVEQKREARRRQREELERIRLQRMIALGLRG